MVRYICWALKKTLLNLWILVFTSTLSKLHFSIIECNFKVIDLSILVMHDVQYDATTYGFKINWIFIFVNHKRTTHMLNAWVLIFDGVHLRNIYNFNNFLLKLNMYVSLSRCSRFQNSENVMFSLFKILFKIQKLLLLVVAIFFFLKGTSFNSSGFNIVVLFMEGKG